MLTEERYNKILNLLSEQKTVSVSQLTSLLETSESTVRRDLLALDRAGKLNRIHGGATIQSNRYIVKEDDISVKSTQRSQEKTKIGAYAAQLITNDDFVYIDAGTTTLRMIDFIAADSVTFVTNGIHHAARLSERGFKTYLLGGRLKASTQAVIGTEAVKNLASYNFTKGFFGTNGISATGGYSTADFSEGNVKREAFLHCQRCYVLADNSKFKQILPVSFGRLTDAAIITDYATDKKYQTITEVVEVTKLS